MLFRKNIHAPPQKGLEFPQGEGRVSVRPKQFEEMNEIELGFLEGWEEGGVGALEKNPYCGG